jgi:uncharacterized C2H2 Zn-finger protein
MFKKITFIIAAIVILTVQLCFAENGKVLVYYFHGSMRCPTCHKLEQYSKEAIESNFKNELASGRLEFKAVNVEEKDNEHYIKDYNLYTKSLVLSKIMNGKEVDSKNLEKIWEYVGNKQKFLDYVTKATREFLKGT